MFIHLRGFKTTTKRTAIPRVVPPTTSRLTPRNAVVLDGVKSVRQPEPWLRRVTPLALATRLLGNSQSKYID